MRIPENTTTDDRANPISVMVTTGSKKASETLDVCLCQIVLKRETPPRLLSLLLRTVRLRPQDGNPSRLGSAHAARGLQVPVSKGMVPSSHGCRAGARVQDPVTPPLPYQTGVELARLRSGPRDLQMAKCRPSLVHGSVF